MSVKSEVQKAAEAAVEGFRRNLGPFVVAAERTRMPMVFTDAKAPGHPIIFANQSLASLIGAAPDQVLGDDFDSLIAQEAGPEALTQIKAAFEGRSNGDLEVRCRRRDGSLFWAAVFISPVQDESGAVVQHLASFMDLTKHKAGEAHCRMLIEELNHRVRNTLSTVQAIVRQAVRGLSEPVLIQDAIESRLFALSRSHDLLTQESWEGAGLLDLVTKALEPFRALACNSSRFVISGSDTRLSPKVALALGIAFHELAANAMAHGALSNEEGRVLIEWTVERRDDGSGLLVVRWEESDGPPVTAPSRKGFGALVLERGLAHELGGTVRLDYRTDGLVCTMEIPAPKGAHDG
jgi:PAS domain S-box-containing protein